MKPIKNILFPTDGSEESRSAFDVAGALARDCHARLIILAVVPAAVIVYGPPPDAYLEQMQRSLEELQLHDANVRVERAVAEGDPVRLILRTAREANCDLILMTSHGRTGIGRFLTRSVAERVVRRSRCPVLVVKGRGVPDGPGKPSAPSQREESDQCR
jgi:nucleotide-binding universal stress UspA family protein